MKDFLTKAGWGDAAQMPLAGDASARRYTRLIKGEDRAILMQDPDGDTALFARLARHLMGIGLSAPQILAEAPGLLLLEDLGDGLIARLCDQGADETALYLTATDALIALHGHAPPSDLPLATPERLAQMTDLAFRHYANCPELHDDIAALFLPLLQAHALPADVMVLRDYHAENILDLPDRTGPARAGLLDFQDALIGHRAYDLVSLLHDIRRNVSPATQETCLTHYCTATGLDRNGFETAFHLLGAQRNLRILGVFARLATEHSKPRYLDLLPQVWTQLQRELCHPALTDLARALAPILPEPTPDFIEGLRAQCPTP
ncbi:MAG: phosphotransferase [Pelagimonas sp.]|jgi:aminoglycoside/choline kinase family phosphotransferase|nr:phosphotransferase [Pelagimonas sp.]